MSRPVLLAKERVRRPLNPASISPGCAAAGKSDAGPASAATTAWSSLATLAAVIPARLGAERSAPYVGKALDGCPGRRAEISGDVLRHAFMTFPAALGRHRACARPGSHRALTGSRMGRFSPLSPRCCNAAENNAQVIVSAWESRPCASAFRAMISCLFDAAPSELQDRPAGVLFSASSAAFRPERRGPRGAVEPPPATEP